MLRRKPIFVALTITILYLMGNLLIMKDYALSWDFHYHFFAGLYHLGIPVDGEKYRYKPLTLPDSRLTVEDPFGPFTQIIPTVSLLLFNEKLHLLPLDSAYNLPMVIFGAMGVGLTFLMGYMMFGWFEGLLASLFLGLLPNYFGYIHNNMKDIPNAFAFALAIYLFYGLEKKRSLLNLVLAVLAFAFAFNIKINSIIIPAVCLLWFILSNINPLGKIIKGKFQVINEKRINLIILYFLLAPVAALLLWWPFWKHPLQKILEIPYFYSHNTLDIPVLIWGKIYMSGRNIPWIYPYLYIIINQR